MIPACPLFTAWSLTLEGFCAADDVEQLLGDRRLPRLVVREREVRDQRVRVVRRVVHGLHARGVLARERLEQQAVEEHLDEPRDELLEDHLRARLEDVLDLAPTRTRTRAR